MANFPDWLNAGAATLAAIFSYLAWRTNTRAPEPEVVLTGAKMVREEGEESYAEVRLSVRNLTEKTLYVRGISFARTAAPLEVAQDYDRDFYGGQGKPKAFQGKTVEKVTWMVVKPAGSVRSIAGGMGDTLLTNVRLRFLAQVPDHIVAEITYSYGSPSGRKHKIKTNGRPLDTTGG